MSTKLADAFEAFAGGAGMDGSAFARCVRDAGLLKGGLKAEEADLVFVTCRPRGARKIDMAHFRRALALVAAKKGVNESLIEELVCAARGPAYLDGTASGKRSRSATRPHRGSPTRLFDDKSTYTGTHRHGGPDVLGSGIPLLGYRDLSDLVNRDRVQRGACLPKPTGHEREDPADEGLLHLAISHRKNSNDGAMPLDGADRWPEVGIPTIALAAEHVQDPTDTKASSALPTSPSQVTIADPATLAPPPSIASSTELLPGSGLLVPCTVTHLQHRPLPVAPPIVVWPGCAVHPQNNGAPSAAPAYAAVLPPAALVSPRPAKVRGAVIHRSQYEKQHSISRESMATVPAITAVSPSPPLSPRHLSSPVPGSRTSAMPRVPTEPVTGPGVAAISPSPPLSPRRLSSPFPGARAAALPRVPTEPVANPGVAATTAQQTATAQHAVVAQQASAAQQATAVQHVAATPTTTGPPPDNFQAIVQQGAAAQASTVQQTTLSPQVSSPQASTSPPVAVTQTSSPAPAPPPSPSSVHEAVGSLAAPPTSSQQDVVTQQASSEQQAAVAQQAAVVHQTVAAQKATAAQQVPAAQHAGVATASAPQAVQVKRIQKNVIPAPCFAQ